MPSTKVKKGSSSKKKNEVVEEVVVEEVVEEEVVEKQVSKKKSVITKDEYLDSFDAMMELLDQEVSNVKGGKPVGIKFLKSLSVKVKCLKRQANKLIKAKRGSRKSTTVQSGFLKPVPISDELRKFAGWEKDELHSRVDVTKFICDYIKDKDLQNPDDRRQIVPDKQLKKILGISGKLEDPLHYYNIQTHIKHHFS